MLRNTLKDSWLFSRVNEHAPEKWRRQRHSGPDSVSLLPSDRTCSGKVRAAAPPPASRALTNIYLKAFSAIFHPFPCLPEKESGTGFRDWFQFVTELSGRLRLGGYAPEYVHSLCICSDLQSYGCLCILRLRCTFYFTKKCPFTFAKNVQAKLPITDPRSPARHKKTDQLSPIGQSPK